MRRKQGILSKELNELLALVRLKEAEIAENDSRIHKVEKNISEVISEFRETQANIDMKHDNLHLSLSKLESESETLSIKKKEIDEFIFARTTEEVKTYGTCQTYFGGSKNLSRFGWVEKEFGIINFEIQRGKSEICNDRKDNFGRNSYISSTDLCSKNYSADLFKL